MLLTPPISTLFPYTTLFRSTSRGPGGGPWPPARSSAAAGHPSEPARRTPAPSATGGPPATRRSEEHTSELQSRRDLVCRLLLEKKKIPMIIMILDAIISTVM